MTDHAGRRDPPFAHGIAAVDRRMDYSTIISVTMAFAQLLFGKGEYDNPSSVLYREYVRFALTKPSVLDVVLKAYVGDFESLPSPEKTNLSLRFRAGDRHQPKRILIVHENDVEFSDLVECAARIGAVLYASDVRWTSITSGRDAEVPGGVVVRFVPKDSSSLSGGMSGDSSTMVMALDDVPFNEVELAEKMFGASPVAEEEESRGKLKASRESRRGYESNREVLVDPPAEFQASTRLSPEEIRAAIGLASGGAATAVGGALGPAEAPTLGSNEPPREDSESAASVGVWIGVGLGGVFAIVLTILLVMGLSGKPEGRNEEPVPGESTGMPTAIGPVPSSRASVAPSVTSSAGGHKIEGNTVVFEPDSANSSMPVASSASTTKKPGNPKKPPSKCNPFHATSLSGCKK